MSEQTAGRAGTFRQLIALDPNAEQREAVNAPFDGCYAILGAAATGKSTALGERIARARLLDPTAEFLVVRSFGELHEYAVALLRSRGDAVTPIDDVDAELLFREACGPLFGMQWAEFADNKLDPEVPGLRTPDRFLAAAFRLICRLRDASIDPAQFLAHSLRGATEFYANPPNFADPALLLNTKNTYHDSLDVDVAELQRQYRRELDLAKILAKLFESYVDLVARTGRMTGRDAVGAAARRLREDAAFATEVRARHRLAFVDDAQDLTDAEVGLLAAIFGGELHGVTLCGDADSEVATFRRTQPKRTFALAGGSTTLREVLRRPKIVVERAESSAAEAAFIAERVQTWLEEGVRPERIAVIFRSVRNVERYETALLDRNVAVAVAGDVNVFADRRTLDAMALLWNVHDPFRHEWLLRTLTGRSIGLSDASLALLCSEPPDPQRSLFVFDDEAAPTTRSSRWDPKRDLRLGWNVIAGERDDALSPVALERVRRFRALRERWVDLADTVALDRFARVVWAEGLAREGATGSARDRAQQLVLRRLLGRLGAFVLQNAPAYLDDVLRYADERAQSDLETCEALDDAAGFVQMLSVEAARGREFDRVAIADVRPGSFPLWYAPDAFLFSPRLGMIAKENAGDARAARTAKFSYYIFRTKAAQHYNERERRALHYGLRRARETALVTAWGTPTRGITAPELLEELR